MLAAPANRGATLPESTREQRAQQHLRCYNSFLGIGGHAMPERFVRAEFYRRRAEELRTIAQDYISDETMRTLSRVARDYEDMAAIMERSAKREGIEPNRK